MSARAEYAVQHLDSGEWWPETPPMGFEKDAISQAEYLRRRYKGHKYRVVVRMVTDWQPMDEEREDETSIS